MKRKHILIASVALMATSFLESCSDEFLQDKKNYDYAFSMAMATGGASAASDYLATKPEVEASLKMVDLKYLV